MCCLGRIGGPLILITGTAILFSGNDPSSGLRSVQSIATIPEFLWELSLGIYCAGKGFRLESPILRADAAREDRVEGSVPPSPTADRPNSALRDTPRSE